MLKMKKIITLALMLVLSLSIARAQEETSEIKTLPDSPGYVIKIFFEDTITILTFDKEAKARRFIKLAEKRLAEAKELSNTNREKYINKTLERYNKHLEKAQIELDKIKSSPKGIKASDFIKEVDDNLAKHQLVLSEVYNKLPDSAKLAIQRILNRTIENQIKVRESVEEIEDTKFNRELRICPTVCVPMYRLTEDECEYISCGSGCGVDNNKTFSTPEECKLRLPTLVTRTIIDKGYFIERDDNNLVCEIETCPFNSKCIFDNKTVFPSFFECVKSLSTSNLTGVFMRR